MYSVVLLMALVSINWPRAYATTPPPTTTKTRLSRRYLPAIESPDRSNRRKIRAGSRPAIRRRSALAGEVIAAERCRTTHSSCF